MIKAIIFDCFGVLTTDTGKNQSLLHYIAQLKKDYRIGLLSNISTDWITRDFLSKTEAELFDALVFSYQIGVTKPHPRAYQITAEKLKMEPQDCLFVDDSAMNCEGAKNVGMKALVYTDFETLMLDLKSML